MLDKLTLVNGALVFWADDGANGWELWRSDGTTNGTNMIANIGAGAVAGSDISINDTPMTVINGIAYFRGADAIAGSELWRTDGTASGTYRLSDVAPGSSGSDIQDLMVVGSRLFFTATPEPNMRELWTTDGTKAGTHRVIQVPRNAIQTLPTEPVVVGGALFFVADDGTHGAEVWRVSGDGASGGMIADLNTMKALADPSKTLGSEPAGLIVVGNDVVFGAHTMTGPNQLNGEIHFALFRVSPTGNTITKILDTDYGIYPSQPITMPGGTFFHADGSTIAWRTDGTTANTGPMTTLNLEYGIGGPVLRDGAFAYFIANRSGSSEGGIWRSDGTIAGTTEYAVFSSGVATDLVLLGGHVYYVHSSLTTGAELWTSDGTSAGTHIVSDVLPGPLSGGALTLIASNGKLFFVANDSEFNQEPWASDGTEAGTQKLADITTKYQTENSEILFLGNMGGSVFFRADDGAHGVELWASDGTTAGTRMLTSAQPDNQGITPQHFVPLGTGVGLFELTDSTGTDLWRTDGTPAGTFKVFDFPGTQNSGEPFYYGTAVLNGCLYFTAFEVNGIALWRTDGTVAGTQRVTVLPIPYPNAMHIWPATANSRIFMFVDGNNPTLMSSDGTAAGTVTVASPVNPASVNEAVALQNRVCFTQYFDPDYSEVYCSDGTPGNLEAITDFKSLGAVATTPYVVNGLLLVNGLVRGGGTAAGLYATDGTANGAHKISDLLIDYGPIPVSGGSRLAWTEPEVFGGFDILVTDGTAAGTHSILPGDAAAHTQVLPMIGAFGDAVMYWFDGDLGPVLWKANADGSGTRFVADVDTIGIDQPRNGNFQELGGQLLFNASRQDIGDELWKISATAPNSADDSATTPFNTAVTVDVLANDALFAGSLSAASVQIVTPPASGTTSINPATGAITYMPNTGFSGGDVFAYRVSDGAGIFSNAASVSIITTTSVSSTGPGSEPVTPPPGGGGGSNSGGGSGGGGKGGGGALGVELFGLACAWLLRRRRCH
jgi:ELWxxDGT repeat protein